MHGSAVSKSNKKLVSVRSGGLMNVVIMSYYSNLRMALKLGKLIKLLDLWKRQPYKDADNYG